MKFNLIFIRFVVATINMKACYLDLRTVLRCSRLGSENSSFPRLWSAICAKFPVSFYRILVPAASLAGGKRLVYAGQLAELGSALGDTLDARRFV